MAPLFLDELLPWHGPVVSGTAIALILFISAAVQVAVGRLPVHWNGAVGLISLALSNALLVVNLWTSSALLFGLGVLLTSIGHALCMLSGMSMINRLAIPANRSGMLASFMVIGYVGSMVPMMGMGWIADHWGMAAAIRIFCSLTIIACVPLAVLFLRNPHTQPLPSS